MEWSAEGAIIEAPQARRGWDLGRGLPLPSRLGGRRELPQRAGGQRFRNILGLQNHAGGTKNIILVTCYCHYNRLNNNGRLAALMLAH